MHKRRTFGEECVSERWHVGGSGSSLSGVPFRRSQRRAGGAEIEYPIVVLDRVAESEVPLSRNTSIALADQNTACVIVSYEVQAHCVERAGIVVGRFGREGDGPGEFQSMIELVRGPGGVVGLRDSRLARLTVFRPGRWRPASPFSRFHPASFGHWARSAT